MAKPKDGRNGALIVIEGQDGSGKSTQLDLLAKWLESSGFSVVRTRWKDSPVVSPLLKDVMGAEIVVNPFVFSFLHAADLAHRVTTQIRPGLKAGQIVLADRYIYTAYARDVVRGLDRKFLEPLYSFAPEPDMVFYFHVPVETAVSRKSDDPKFYEAGQDLNLSSNRTESFKIFQTLVINEYQKLAKEHNFKVIDGTEPIYVTAPKVKKTVQDFIKDRFGVVV